MYIPYRKAYLSGMNPLSFVTFFTFGELGMMSALAVGYLGFDGTLDTCITIRTAVIAKGVCRIEAGAGIVADSDPAAEEAETRAKARALLRAIELATEGGVA